MGDDMTCNCQKKECENKIPEWAHASIEYKFYCPPYLKWVGELKTSKGWRVRCIRSLAFFAEVTGKPWGLDKYEANLNSPYDGLSYSIILQNYNLNILPALKDDEKLIELTTDHKIIGVWTSEDEENYPVGMTGGLKDGMEYWK